MWNMVPDGTCEEGILLSAFDTYLGLAGVNIEPKKKVDERLFRGWNIALGKDLGLAP